MTPEDVVARARELEGQEVLLTVRGVVTRNRGSLIVRMPNAGAWDIGLAFDHDSLTNRDLVSIEPAPMRIEMGELYGDNDSEVYQGNPDGSLSAFGIKGKIDPEQVEGLRLLKVVNA